MKRLTISRTVVCAVASLAFALVASAFQESKQTAAGGQAATSSPAPAADLTGEWIFNRQVKTRSGETRTQVLTMTLRQDGNRLTGDTSFTTINVNRDGRFAVHGWIEGNQVSISAW